MFLEVAVDNPGAQQLYEEHGFERVGLRPDYYQRANGKRANAYTMRCDLARRLAAGALPERLDERAFG
jgi:ribosomal protein S18 acetylase RimI-like enzyme